MQEYAIPAAPLRIDDQSSSSGNSSSSQVDGSTTFTTRVHVGLYTDVSNAAQLKQQVMSKSPPADLDNVVLIDARMIVDIRQCLAALHRAVHQRYYAKMKTRTIGSELMYCLSPVTNIATSLKTFGLSDDTTAVLAVKFVDDEQTNTVDASTAGIARMLSRGTTQVDLDQLPQVCDRAKVAACYKVPDELSSEQVLQFIVECIALKGIL
ncbi:hypothetical protein RI367_008292 [Sorochytrium milnesiophthora]